MSTTPIALVVMQGIQAYEAAAQRIQPMHSRGVAGTAAHGSWDRSWHPRTPILLPRAHTRPPGRWLPRSRPVAGRPWYPRGRVPSDANAGRAAGKGNSSSSFELRDDHPRPRLSKPLRITKLGKFFDCATFCGKTKRG
eukprot:1144854-Prymnesium_polylepis.1